jgi:putative membrane protein insertion efficiency factor
VKRTGVAAAAVLLAAAAVVGAQPLAIGGIHLYQRAVSPLASRVGIRCRFTPTCSRYAEAAIVRDGVVRGGWKAVGRIARCGPWTAQGTRDEP